MANLTGFPNTEATVLTPPFFFETLGLADLNDDAYIGMPIGTTILVTNFNASGNGTYAMKMSTFNESAGDWFALGGTFIDAGLPLND